MRRSIQSRTISRSFCGTGFGAVSETGSGTDSETDSETVSGTSSGTVSGADSGAIFRTAFRADSRILPKTFLLSLLAAAALVFPACEAEEEESGATPIFAPESDFAGSDGAFFNFPFPADHRLRTTGEVVNETWPRPFGQKELDSILITAQDRKGFSRIPVAWFAFDAALKELDEEEVVDAKADSPLLLVDLSKGREGTLYPVVAKVLEEDEVLPANVLALAPVPGTVLPAGRYAFVVQRSLRDAAGKILGIPAALEELHEGKAPDISKGKELLADYEALWPVLDKLGIGKRDVSVATVFSTDNVVQELRELVDTVSASHSKGLELTGLAVAETGDHELFCELHGTLTLPQFQAGVPPFDNKGGLFDFESGKPKVQRSEEIPVVVNLPKGEMPKDGFPLMLYVHGSGGVSTQVVDRGRIEVEGGAPRAGEGPAFVVAHHGIASASSAMPVNPQRVRNAGETAYLNFSNLAAFRDTFRQGVVEQRLFLDTLLKAKISPEALAGCSNAPTLPAGESAFFFRDRPAAMGQSMGAMYVNLFSAVEDRFGAVVPTGAGGFWTWFILETGLIEGAGDLIGVMLKIGGKPSFMHPSLHLVQLAWEVVDPLVSASEVSRLNTKKAKHIYQPVGLGDTYFPTKVLDAMALSYGHQQAGKEVWTTTQKKLKLAGKDGIISYPVKNNLKSATGSSYTGVVVQYEGDGVYDPHSIAFQREDVKHQYACFLKSYFDTGDAVVPAPADFGVKCK